MERLSFDTTFLIDFQRERNRNPGPAHAFLQKNSDCAVWLPVVAAGEFAEGFASRSDVRYLSVLESFQILPITKTTIDIYAGIVRFLRGKGLLIGTNDLWIAAVTLQAEMPLVTRNVQHFHRIPDLKVIEY